jgi:hypothetical protein
MGKHIGSSSSPKALATSFPVPPGPDIAAMGTVGVIAGAGHRARSATTAAK